MQAHNYCLIFSIYCRNQIQIIYYACNQFFGRVQQYNLFVISCVVLGIIC